MNSGHLIKYVVHASKRLGQKLLCEMVTFALVFTVCSIGNLLTMVALLECFFIPHFGNLVDVTVTSDPSEIVTHVMSLPFFSVIMLFSTAATIFIVILFCRLIQKRSWRAIGLSHQHAFSFYIRGFFWGAIAISIVVAICVIANGGHFESGDRVSAFRIILFLLAYLIQGASEEILCRGYFMYSIARRHPIWVAVVVSSAFFALLHLPNNGVSMYAFLNLFLFGVFAALVTHRTGSIWLASGFHSAWNFFQGNFYGIKVSGTDMHESIFHFVSDPSRAYLNGGDFGIEGGLLCTALLLVFILALLYKNHRAA